MVTGVPTFRSIDTYEIKDRGTAITVENPGGYPEPNVLRDHNVIIDGDPYFVRGVETYAISRPYPDRYEFGLLADPGWRT